MDNQTRMIVGPIYSCMNQRNGDLEKMLVKENSLSHFSIYIVQGNGDSGNMLMGENPFSHFSSYMNQENGDFTTRLMKQIWLSHFSSCIKRKNGQFLIDRGSGSTCQNTGPKSTHTRPAETRIVAFFLMGQIDWLAQNELGEKAAHIT